jgi:hypothetical protein
MWRNFNLKIIFLDFDGVVNAFNEPESLRKLSEACVEMLNLLVEKTDADIVITSTWRILHSMADLRQILINAGFKFPYKVIGKTPRGGRRGTEIEEWLKAFPKEIELFVILDDDSDMEPFMDRLIRTNSDTGLTIDDVERAIFLFT